MDKILLALHVVLPLLMLMLVGTVSRKTGLLNDEFIRNLNKLIFNVLLPCLMFVNVYRADVDKVFNPKLIGYAMGVTTLVFLLSFKIVPIFEKENNRRGALIQAIVRGNGAYFGIPVTVGLVGQSYAGLMALVVSFSAILYNLFSVIAFESFRGGKPDLKRIFFGVVKNPMIIGTLAGIIFAFGRIPIPDLLWGTIEDISKIATPLALITLGGSFVFTSAGKYKKEIAAGVILKLVVIPAVALFIAVHMEFAYYEICCLFSLLAAPTAVATFAVAQQMDGDEVLAGQLVVFSSISSVFTMFIWIVVFGPYMLSA